MTSDAEQPRSTEHQEQHQRLVDPILARNLAIAFVIIALGIGFGRPLAAGYYFGGCDHTEQVQHDVIHVFGVEMCHDSAIASAAERTALREAEAPSLAELTEGEAGSSPEAGAPAGGAGGAGEPAHT
jgi:hypothetical protein